MTVASALTEDRCSVRSWRAAVQARAELVLLPGGFTTLKRTDGKGREDSGTQRERGKMDRRKGRKKKKEGERRQCASSTDRAKTKFLL